MRFNSRALFGRTWQCSSCTRAPSIAQQVGREYSQLRPVKLVKERGATNRIFLAIATVTIGGSAYLLRDDIRHGYLAAVRSGRVAGALFVNIQDYRTIMKKEYGSPEEQESIWQACHKRCAERTLKVLEKNGSIFIKLGQHLTSMGYLLPKEWVTTFIPLQDKCPVSSYESIEEMYMTDMGRRIEDDFEEFSKLPIGAASLAQVHTASLKGGQKVAVKVQHPTLDEWAPLDLALTRYTFRTLKKAFPEYDMEWLSKEMDFSLPQELDFNMEGQNAMIAKDYFKRNTKFPLIIPQVYSASRRILVMEHVAGARIDNLEYLDSHNISRDEVSATLARVFNTMIFASGAPLHCDPHGGNIAIRSNPARRYPHNFELILYDHGLYRTPEDKLRRDYAKLWLAVIDGNEERMRKYAFDVAGITKEQFPLFASAITGRDYRVLTQGKVAASERDEGEKEVMSEALGDGLLEQLVQLLGKVPRIMLLILKTNDLTRSLDESLHTEQGPARTFLILAKYASRTVWQEEKEAIRRQGSVFQPRNLVHFLTAWLSFVRIELKLWGYERYLSVRRQLHMA